MPCGLDADTAGDEPLPLLLPTLLMREPWEAVGAPQRNRGEERRGESGEKPFPSFSEIG